MNILKRLQGGNNCIVDIDLSPDRRKVEVTEACDSYFSVELTKAEFAEWIAELQAMHGQMVD